MSQSEPWTIGRLLQWTTDYLKQHGSENPRLDAEVLLAHARGGPRIALYTSFNDEASENLRTSFRELVRRRAEGTPVAHLVGHREFYSLDFLVRPEVLIPRPETEFLVVTLLDLIKQRIADGAAHPASVADVGTGSGIIAICAARFANARVTAIDLSGPALEVARENAERLGVSDRIEFLESDLLSALSPERRFDFVVSNPPYISDEEMQNLPRDVKNFEPHLALSAGPTGTAVIERLIPQAADRLNSGGSLLLEISPMIENRVRDRIIADGRFELLPTVKDLAGLPRVVSARLVNNP